MEQQLHMNTGRAEEEEEEKLLLCKDPITFRGSVFLDVRKNINARNLIYHHHPFTSAFLFCHEVRRAMTD